jgi:hypothetical protein
MLRDVCLLLLFTFCVISVGESTDEEIPPGGMSSKFLDKRLGPVWEVLRALCAGDPNACAVANCNPPSSEARNGGFDGEEVFRGDRDCSVGSAELAEDGKDAWPGMHLRSSGDTDFENQVGVSRATLKSIGQLMITAATRMYERPEDGHVSDQDQGDGLADADTQGHGGESYGAEGQITVAQEAGANGFESWVPGARRLVLSHRLSRFTTFVLIMLYVHVTSHPQDGRAITGDPAERIQGFMSIKSCAE